MTVINYPVTKTNSKFVPENIGRAPKGKACLPTIHFQVSLLSFRCYVCYVGFREDN